MLRRARFDTIPLSELSDKAIAFDPSIFRPLALIVDDEQVIADTLAAILTGNGFACMVAYDGESALQTAQVIPPQLLLTDVSMPGMSGIDLAVCVQTLVPDCLVMLFSGHADASDSLADPRYAAHRFSLLRKPLHPTELLAHLSRTYSSDETRSFQRA